MPGDPGVTTHHRKSGAPQAGQVAGAAGNWKTDLLQPFQQHLNQLRLNSPATHR
jgi:hypothetical protein